MWASAAFGPLRTNKFGNPATTVEANEVMPVAQWSARLIPSSPRTISAYGWRCAWKPVASTTASMSAYRAPEAATSTPSSTAARADGSSTAAPEASTG